MPSLNDTLRTSLAGFVPAEPARPSPPPPSIEKTGNFSQNVSIRCPLPPFNAGPDVLRQFDESSGISPKRRVIPLPISTVAGNGGTTVNNTTVISSASSAASTPSLTAKTVSYFTAILSPGAYDARSITMAKSYQLVSLVANAACDFRLYGSASAQAADIGRLTDSPVPAEVLSNIVSNVIFDTTPYVWPWQDRGGTNSDTPQTTSAYVTVINTGIVAVQIQIAITFLPLEV